MAEEHFHTRPEVVTIQSSTPLQ